MAPSRHFFETLFGEGSQAAEELRVEQFARAAQEAFTKTSQLCDEHTEKVQKAMEKIAKMHDDVLKAVQRQTEELFTRTWEGMWTRLGEQTTKIVSEAVSQGMRLSMSSRMISDVKPGFGEAGTSIGKTLGKAAGEVLGAAWGPMGSMIGGAAGGVAGGLVVDTVSMQMEGYRMMGARATPTAYAGREPGNVDFEEVGRKYRAGMQEIVVATGASADEVEKLAQALSRLGVGFLEGGKEEAEFALAAERALNLQSGTVEKLQTRAVREYGEELGVVRGQINLVNMEMLKMNILAEDQHNAFAKTWQGGQNFIDALGQIESGVKNTSVSMESMNEMSRLMLETMTLVGDTRSGAQVKTATDLISGFAPQAGKDAADETRRSAAISMLLGRTSEGKDMLSRLTAVQQKYPGMGLAAASEMFANDPNNPMGSGDFMMDMMFGASDMIHGGGKRGLAQTQAVLSRVLGMNVSQTELQRMTEDVDVMRSKGITHAMTDKEVEERLKDDPKAAEKWKDLKDIQERAKKQGEAQLSQLQRIGNVLTDISIWTNGTMGGLRDRLGQVLGVSKPGEHATWGDLAGKLDPTMALANEVAKMLGLMPASPPSQQPAKSDEHPAEPTHETTHIPDQTAQHVVKVHDKVHMGTSPGH